MGLEFAIRPTDFEEIDFVRGPQAEMHAEIVLRKVASAASDLVGLARFSRHNADPGADGGAITVRACQLQSDPVILVRGFEPIEVHRFIYVVDHDIDVAVIIDVAERRAPSGPEIQQRPRNLFGDVLEAFPFHVAINDLALPVAGLGRQLVDLRIDVAVHLEDVNPPVVVEVDKAATPAKKAGVHSDTPPKCDLFKSAFARVLVEVGGVAGKVGFEYIEPAVPVIVSGGNAHSRLRLAVLTVSAPGLNTHVGKGAVVVVAIQGAGIGVVGDVDVRPAIVVEVENQNAESVRSVSRCNPGFPRDIVERPIPVVPIQDVGSPVCHEKIDKPVVVIIAQAYSLAPTGFADSRLGGNVCE